MKRDKRTFYLMPDLAKRVDEAAASGGLTPSAIVETAVDEHFSRESVYGAVEGLTRRYGELEERVSAMNEMLTKMDAAIGVIGRSLVGIRESMRQPQPPQEIQPRQEVEHEGRSGGLLGAFTRRSS
jgi:hypothetical protein